MRRKKLIINAFILTFSTMMIGFISTSFRVYLSNKIGPEGMGLYQLIMSIHVMATTLSVSGIRVTTTRLIAEELGKSNIKNIKSILMKSMIYSFLFSTTTFFIIYNFADVIALKWIGDDRAIIPIKILSCSLPFVGISACFHGYFYGMRKIIKSISSDIVEVGSMMIIIIAFMGICLPKGLNFTCALIAIGTTIGNIASAIYFCILFLFEKKTGYKSGYSRNNKYSFFKIFSISFPIACSSYIQTGLRTVEDLLIPDALRRYGSSTASSLSIFGMIKGMALPILNFPSIFLASFSTLIIPEIAEANALNQHKRVIYIISKVFKFTLLIAVFASGLFIIFSEELGLAIYNNTQVGLMMKILAPLIPFMYLDRIVDGSLNALDCQLSTLKFNLIDMSVRIFLILYLIPKKGIEGFIIVLFAGTLLNASLSINKLLKVTKIQFKLFDWIIKPMLCIAIAGCFVKYSLAYINLNLHISIQIILSIALYLILLIISGCITKKDILWFIEDFKAEPICLEWHDLSIYKRF
ncbi:oligosaccharide flippase family protein [Romboutsia sp. 13368]|uniref:oligosaccharide flippase family protein n=1 Tax=Romboutsia sp. 13368 TaxID=2708053 RepID=UPI0025E2674B|nr:oligosaccharide flippase family protein [Romboutsia sp. 13368]